jgi:hypothetical protein
MRNRKGTLGQVIESPIVLIGIFLLMLIFYIFSGVLGATKNKPGDIDSGLVIEKIDSRVLGDLFLGDFLQVGDEEILVREYILKFSEASDEGKREIKKDIENLFDEKYGCDRKNRLLIVRLIKDVMERRPNEFDTSYYYAVPINYPVDFGTQGFEVYQNFEEVKDFKEFSKGSVFYSLGNQQRYVKGVLQTFGDFKVYIKGDLRCLR